MASTPIYENPNGRRRRKGYSTEVRNKILEAKEYYNINSPDFEFNTMEHMFYRTGAYNVKSPWANTTNAKFKSYVGEGRTVKNYSYNKEELQSFIEETAKIIQQDYGLENIDVRTVFGTVDGEDKFTNGMFSWNDKNPNINHIDIYADTIWRDYGNPNGRKANRFVKGGGIENVKEKIKETLAHEMRHQWQHTTETGKAIEETNDIYKQTKINDYTDDFNKYYHKPVEVDARYHGEKFRKTYELKLKKYKENLEQQGFNKEFRNKIEEINLRPKNRIIGHQFEKEPINISSYRKFDNVEPIDWDIDTGNKSPINKYDVSKNTRYKNAKLNKGQKSLRPTVTMDGNNVEIDSIYNHSVPKKINKAPEPEPYTPKIGDNVIDSETGERYVLSQIDEANPDLDIHSDTYYYNSPNGERLTRTSPIDPNKNSNYKLDYDDMLSPDDVRRISNSFNDLETNTNLLDEAKSRLSSLKDQFDNGADNLNEIYEAEKAVRSLESKVANARMQIDEDDLRYNSNGKYAYNINDKTRSYMDKADNLLGDYSETKYLNSHEEVFKEVKPRQIIEPIESGIDNAINVPTKNTVKSNINKRRRTAINRTTGRGNRVINNTPVKRGMPKGTVKTKASTTVGRQKIKKSGSIGRGGKATKLKPVGRNGKALSSIPRTGVPLTKKQLVKTAANLVVNNAATNTANTLIKNIPTNPHINTPHVNTPTPNTNIPNTPNTNTPNVPNTPSNNFSPNYDPNNPTTWTDADIDEMAQGDPHYEDSLRKQRQQAINALNTGNSNAPTYDPNDPVSWTDEDIAKIANGDPELADDLIELRKNAKNGILPQGPISKIGPGEIDNSIPNTYHIDAPDTEIEGFGDLGSTGRLGVVDKVMTGVNILGAVGDYKTARREGHGVVSSAVRAGAKFAVDEALGLWAIPVALVKTAPGLAIKGADMLYKENRRMNSAANFQVFGDAQFMDTQQLATMRQSGMEMAKMSQYNLQQTLMGNEATYLHR